jgi:hypothetical protein
MSLRKKWFHFYSYFLKVAPSSGMGLRFVFSGIRFSGVLRMGMAFIFSMSSMAQATPKQREAVVKVVMAEIPWNQRPMKLTELMDYGKNFLPPILLQQLQANYMLYGDIEIPKMEVSRVKVGSQEHVRLTMTEKGMTNTITLIDDGKVFARLNDKVDILKEDMRSLTTVVAKVYQAIPVQAPKGPFLDDWDYGRLTPKGRLEYIKKLREIMVLMEKIQNNSGQGSTPDISWNLPIDDSTSKAEVNFEQNPMTTTAGFFPHSGLSFSTATAVFKSWWRYVLSGAQAAAGGSGPVILAGGVYDSTAEYNNIKKKECTGSKGATIYCEPTMFPMQSQCIEEKGSSWTDACYKNSGGQNITNDNIKSKLTDIKRNIQNVSQRIDNVCAVKEKVPSECNTLRVRKDEIQKILNENTAANTPSQPPASSNTQSNDDIQRIAAVNTYCGQKSLSGIKTTKLSTSEGNGLAPLQSESAVIQGERVTDKSAFKAYCQCESPNVSIYDVAPSEVVASMTINSSGSSSASSSFNKDPRALVLKSCTTSTPEKPAGGGSGGGSSRRSQWWNPSSWCESSTCRMGLGIGAVGLTLGLGIMGYRQSMKAQENQQRAQQEWYANMLGGGAATMPPTMSLYTPSALRPTDMFNTNFNTNTQDTLR